MHLAISDLRALPIGPIGSAGETAQAAAGVLDGALDAAVRADDRAPRWRGACHDAVLAKLASERDHADEVRNVLAQIADEAMEAGVDLTHAREAVLRTVDAALADGFRVTDSGLVHHGDVSKQERAQSLTASIQRGLAVAGTLDDDYGARLEALRDDLAGMVDGQPEVITPAGGRADADAVVTHLVGLTPAARRAYVNLLTPTDRRHVAQANPQIIGNLDGIDFATRAAANEINIRAALIAEQQAGRGAPGQPRADRLRAFLRHRRFLAFDNSTNGHFIEMVGEIGADTRTATVVVPGTFAGMNTSADESAAATELARRTGGPVFVYLDGDLPQQLGHERLPAILGLVGAAGLPLALRDSAADPRFAREMAPRLVSFARELDTELAAHTTGVRTTVIGHSYGGSVVGSAEQLGLRADNVIYASSAGTGVFDGPWRNPNPDVARYSLTAPGDPIQYVQSLPGNPHGHDPDTAPGVIRLDTGEYGDGRLVAGGSGHSDYWRDPDSTAFTNMVKVITGDEPTRYVDHAPDRPTDPLLHVAGDLLRSVIGPVGGGLLDGTIDLPGPLPDIPLRLPRLPWSA
ncbi:alpha/beta hydrolase [Gordonia sp. CPCC 205515]|uniref:alpha/beta hydrolase n=1 Tax=Gordonia sp. CPCC 205515 TaxID=3140791 RepID=UPI003AF3F611